MDTYMKTGDTVPALSTQLKDRNGNVVPLVGASVLVTVRNLATGTLLLARFAKIDTVASTATLEWAAGDLAEEGDYKVEWRATIDGQGQTYPTRGQHILHLESSLQTPLDAGSWDAVRRIRGYVGEPDSDTYTDSMILGIYQAEGSVNAAAARIWREKAAAYADLVNTSESGSSRSLGDLQKKALDMADQFTTLAGVDVKALSRTPARTRRIVRP